MNRRGFLIAGIGTGLVLTRSELALAQGLVITAQVVPLTGEVLNEQTLSETQWVLTRRFGAVGNVSATITVAKSGAVTIEASGVDRETIEALLRRNFVELINPRGEYLANDTLVATSLSGQPWSPSLAAPAAAASPVAGPIYDTIVSSFDIVSAESTVDSFNQPTVIFHLSGHGSAVFYDYTAANIGLPLSILVDNRVVTTPTIMAAIANNGQISGLSPADAQAVAIALDTRPLPVHLVVTSIDSR